MGNKVQDSRGGVVGAEAGVVGRARAWRTLNLILCKQLKAYTQGCDIGLHFCEIAWDGWKETKSRGKETS